MHTKKQYCSSQPCNNDIGYDKKITKMHPYLSFDTPTKLCPLASKSWSPLLRVPENNNNSTSLTLICWLNRTFSLGQAIADDLLDEYAEVGFLISLCLYGPTTNYSDAQTFLGATDDYLLSDLSRF